MHLRRSALVLLVAGVAAGASAAPAGAETIITPSTALTIPTSGSGVPYPSTIDVSGGDGNLTKVVVTLQVTHTHPDDLDIALMSPDGDAELLMSDVCGLGDLSNVTLVLDQDAAGTLADSGPCANGSTRPTNVGSPDAFAAPGPSETSADLGAFTGEDPNGRWQLFATDDVGGDSGGISWSLTLTTGTAEVVMPNTGLSGVSRPYPALKPIAGTSGTVLTDLDVKFPDFSHTLPDDVDLLLRHPSGPTAVVMSDACGTTPIHNFAWTINDEAPAPFTDDTVTGCNPFNIRPANFGAPPETFPAPAPPGPYGTTLAVFDGLDPRGPWQLYAVDDDGSGPHSGFLTSWTVTPTVRPAATTGFEAAAIGAAEGFDATLVVRRTGPAPLGPARVGVSVTDGSATAADRGPAPATLDFARGESTRTLTIPIREDGAAEPAETFTVTLSAPADDAAIGDADTAAVTIPASASTAATGSGAAGGGASQAPRRCVARKVGTRRADRLSGTPLGDILEGGRGNDTLSGLAGDDCLRGGAGRDTLRGGAGADDLRGDAGNDALRGEAGNDALQGGGGNDSLSGADGNDALQGGNGRDALAGGPGTDTFSSGAGNDRLSTADGIAETASCGSGRDRVTADRSDRLSGCETVRRRRR